MSRKKVKLAYIINDAARRATFKKRKKGLMKKVSELSTLCDVDACAIVYSPYDSLPEVWPSQMGVQRVLSKFKMMPEMEQSKRMVDQGNFLSQRIVKVNEQLKKQRRDNRKKEMTRVMFQCLVGRDINDFSIMDLNDMGCLIDQYLKDIEKKMETDCPMAAQGSSPLAAATLLPTAIPPVSAGDLGGMRNVGEGSQAADPHHQQWYTELMNPQDQSQQMWFGREDMVLPFGDTNQSPLWSSSVFP